jgi:hypothetical protein
MTKISDDPTGKTAQEERTYEAACSHQEKEIEYQARMIAVRKSKDETMTRNTPDLLFWDSDEHPSMYRQAWKPYEEKIKILASKIYEELQGHELNDWAKLEILNRVTKQVEEGLGTIIEPDVDVAMEDEHLGELYDQIQNNAEIAKMVLAVVRSTGYRLGRFSISEIWVLAEESHYWGGLTIDSSGVASTQENNLL